MTLRGKLRLLLSSEDSTERRSAVAQGTTLASLTPGRVTALVSLPTVGRSTLSLNMALHATEQGHPALFTSGEITTEALRQKVITARYDFDPCEQEPPGGWSAFKATALPEMEGLPLCLHGAVVGSSARDSLTSGATAIVTRHQRPLGLWVIDTVQHFSEFTDAGLDTATTMRQLHALARRYSMAVLVTAQVTTEYEDEPVDTTHLPLGPVQRRRGRRRPGTGADRPAHQPAEHPPFTIDAEQGRHHWRQLLPALEQRMVMADAYPGMLADDLSDYLFALSTGHIRSVGAVSRDRDAWTTLPENVLYRCHSAQAPVSCTRRLLTGVTRSGNPPNWDRRNRSSPSRP